MPGDPTKAPVGGGGPAVEAEPGAKCPKCDGENILVAQGGALRCGSCGARLSEKTEKGSVRSAGFEVIEGPETQTSTERGFTGR
jgi:tRNA(Ile2) C34 agmatinyltransferase TiaS